MNVTLSKKQIEIIENKFERLLAVGPFGCGKSETVIQFANQCIVNSKNAYFVCNDNQVYRKIIQLEHYWSQSKCEVFLTFRFWQHLYKILCECVAQTQYYLLSEYESRLISEKWFLDESATFTEKNDLHCCYEFYFYEKFYGFESSLDEQFKEKVNQFQLHLAESQKIDLCGLLSFLICKKEDLQNHIKQNDIEFCIDDYQCFSRVEHKVLSVVLQYTNIKIFFDSNGSRFNWRSSVESLAWQAVKKDYDNCKIVKLKKQYRASSKYLSFAHQLEKLAGFNQIVDKSVNRSSLKPEFLYFENKESQMQGLVALITKEMQTSIDREPCAVLFRTHRQLDEFLKYEKRAEVSVKLDLPEELSAWCRLLISEGGQTSCHHLWATGAAKWLGDNFDAMFQEAYHCFGSVGDFFNCLKLDIKIDDSIKIYSIEYNENLEIRVLCLNDKHKKNFAVDKFCLWLEELISKNEQAFFVSNVPWVLFKLQKHFVVLYKPELLESDLRFAHERLLKMKELRLKYKEEIKRWLSIKEGFDEVLKLKNWLVLEEFLITFVETTCQKQMFVGVLKGWFDSFKSSINPLLSNHENMKRQMNDREVYFVDWIVLGTIHACAHRSFYKIWVPHFDEDHYPPLSFSSEKVSNDERLLVAHVLRMCSKELRFLTNQATWRRPPVLPKEMKLI